MEDLHEIWAKGIASDKRVKSQSEEQLRQALTLKTKSSISHINRNMLIDAIVALMISVGIIIFTIYLNLENKGFVMTFILCIIALLAVHYRVKYKMINQVDLETKSIKDGIEKLIDHLEMYKKLYLLLIPLITGLLFTMVHILLFSHLIGPWFYDLSFWAWETLVIPVVLPVYLIVKLLFHRMYGKQLELLKENLLELDNGSAT